MRLINRPLGFVVAVALGVAAVLTIVEVVGYNANHKKVVVDWPSWSRWAERTRWSATVVLTVSIVMIVVGLVLLVIELRRPRPNRIALESSDPATDAAVTRKGLAGTARAAAVDVDGISRAAVVAGRRRVQVTATASARDRATAAALSDPVTESVTAKLAALQLRRPPRVRVRVNPGRA